MAAAVAAEGALPNGDLLSGSDQLLGHFERLAFFDNVDGAVGLVRHVADDVLGELLVQKGLRHDVGVKDVVIVGRVADGRSHPNFARVPSERAVVSGKARPAKAVAWEDALAPDTRVASDGAEDVHLHSESWKGGDFLRLC